MGTSVHMYAIHLQPLELLEFVTTHSPFLPPWTMQPWCTLPLVPASSPRPCGRPASSAGPRQVKVPLRSLPLQPGTSQPVISATRGEGGEGEGGEEEGARVKGEVGEEEGEGRRAEEGGGSRREK